MTSRFAQAQPPPPPLPHPLPQSQSLSSPRSPRGGGRFDNFPSAVHPTSSLRDPLPDATPPGGSRASSVNSELAGAERDDFLVHQTRAGRRRGRGKGDGLSEELDAIDTSSTDRLSPNPRGDKRRRVTSKSSRQNWAPDGVIPSPSRNSHHSHQGSSISPTSPHDPPPPARRMQTLAPIKPIGFAASRESRREEGDQAIPSPVVMGFDFKAIDEEQLKTVRDTISIKEQQQALIAARRREVAASTPSTPKELTFKGWQPKDPDKGGQSSLAPSAPASGGGVGRRRDKTRDKVEGMTIVTSLADKDIIPGSKSAPLNQALSSQQASPREPISGSQTAVPPHILPPLPGYGHLGDLRTAPISHTRTRNGGEERDREHEFARQQYWRPLPRPSGYENMPHTARPAITIPSSDRRNFTAPTNLQPPPGHRDRHSSGPGPRAGNGHYSGTPSPPRNGDGGPRDAFLPPFSTVHDLLHQAEHLRFLLQDLLHRYESAYANQINSMSEFKSTAAQATTLLGTLQASADSLKEMVRYEVTRAGSADKREVDELKERIRLLEDRLDGKK